MYSLLARLFHRPKSRRNVALQAWHTRRRRGDYGGRRHHSGPLRTLKGETYCMKCGVGVDEDGFYERAAATHGRRLTRPHLAARSAHYIAD